jgi:hypothetical protein
MMTIRVLVYEVGESNPYLMREVQLDNVQLSPAQTEKAFKLLEELKSVVQGGQK